MFHYKCVVLGLVREGKIPQKLCTRGFVYLECVAFDSLCGICGHTLRSELNLISLFCFLKLCFLLDMLSLSKSTYTCLTMRLARKFIENTF